MGTQGGGAGSGCRPERCGGEPPQACLRHACAPGPRIRRCSRIPAPVPRLSEGPVFALMLGQSLPPPCTIRSRDAFPGTVLLSAWTSIDVQTPYRQSLYGGFLYCMGRPVSWEPGNSGIHGHGVSGHGGGKSGDLLPGIFPISRQDHLQQPIGQTGK